MNISVAGDENRPADRHEGVSALRRRKALQDFIRANDLEPAAWARQAGLKSANAIYNFLKGRSSSLNSETYERLARAVPGATVAQLVGERISQRPALSHTIRIREIAASGVKRFSPELPDDEQEGATIPEGGMRAQGAFGVRLDGDDMDLDWPKGSLFVFVPLLMGRWLRTASFLFGESLLIGGLRRQSARSEEIPWIVRRRGSGRGPVIRPFRLLPCVHGLRRGRSWTVKTA